MVKRLVVSAYIPILFDPLPDILSMTISKQEPWDEIFVKMQGLPVKFVFYTQAAAASQPKPCLVIIGLSPVKSKIVETS